MRNIVKVIVFIMVAVFINAVMYGFFTVNGYSYLYNLGERFNTMEIVVSDNDFAEYQYFNDSLNRNMVYITESLPVTANQFDFTLDFIKYLNSSTGIKYIIDEIPYSAGQLINVYLNTGDEVLLDEVFAAAPNPAIFSYQRLQYYKKLYQYNQTLEENSKIKFFGIDVEYQEKRYSVMYLDYLLKSVEGRERSSKISEVLNADRSDIVKYYTDLKLSVEKHEALYKELFVDEFFYFHLMVNNFFTASDNDNMRFQDMALNFTKIYTYNLRGKYYGTFSDAAFMDKVKALSVDISNRTYIIPVVSDLWFSDTDQAGKLYTVNNGVLRYFQKYRDFVYKINGTQSGKPYRELGDTYILINAK